jgi:hypothetical protein
LYNQILVGLLADALGLEKPHEQLGPGRPAPPGRFVRERHEVFRKRNADLHNHRLASSGIPGYSVHSAVIPSYLGNMRARLRSRRRADRQARGKQHRLDETAGISFVVSGDVVGGPMIDRGADDGKPDGDVHGFAEA